MPLFIPAQNKWLEASLFLRSVTFRALVTAAAQGMRWGCRCLTVLALMVASAHTGRAQDGIACIVKADTVETGGVLSMRDFPGGGVLIRTAKGFFLARMVNGAVAIDFVANADTGPVFTIDDFAGGVLIGASKGFFL